MPVRTSPRNEDGLQKPRRPKPRDFRDRYIEMGWDRALEDHYRCNWRCIRRWILEEGQQELKAARANYVHQQRHRRRRHVMDRTVVG